MRILYLSQYFPPEVGATQTRAYEMAYHWTRAGNFVTMVTEFPNHPSGIIPRIYKGKFIEKSQMDGIEIIRVWVKTSPIKNFRNRMFFYISYMINAILASMLCVRGKYDFIYATSPPLFVGAAALVITYLKRIPMVFEVRDLWPESAIALNELSNPLAINLSTKLEKSCYQRAKNIVVVTQGIRRRLIERKIPENKIITIPNGANILLFVFDQQKRMQIRKELGLDGKFIAIYAGIHGIAQGLEVILETANILRNNENIHFLFIGEGPKKDDLIEASKNLELSNITFLSEVPREKIPDFLSAADVALIPLKKVELFSSALPSKIFDAWACKRPVIISVDGEARKVVESAQGGIFIPPEDPENMASALVKLMYSPEDLKIMGENGWSYTVEKHSRKYLAETLIAQLAHSLQN